MTKRSLWVMGLCAILGLSIPAAYSEQVGMFENHQDIYKTYDRLGADGGATFDAATDTYTIWGSGWDTWSTDDAFHFVYTTISGDFTLDAVGEFIVDKTTNYASQDWIKIMLMIRQDLDALSMNYATRIRKDGQFSWQERQTMNNTTGVSTPAAERVVLGPSSLNLSVWNMRLQREGTTFTCWYQDASGKWIVVGQPQTLAFVDPVLVGIGVCSHDAGQVCYTKVSQVKLTPVGASAVTEWELFE